MAYRDWMLGYLHLLLPVLFPSWRFFEAVAAAPLLEWTYLDVNTAPIHDWHSYRPAPQHVTVLQMLGRLLWNAQRNEALFVLSCAERLDAEPDAQIKGEILARIWRDAGRLAPANGFIQFRLRFTQISAGQMISETRFASALYPIRNGQLA